MARQKKVEAEQFELVPKEEDPKWLVVTEEDGTHRLLYGKRRQGKGATPAHLARFQTIAKWANDKGIVPAKRGPRCYADHTAHPIKPLTKAERFTPPLEIAA